MKNQHVFGKSALAFLASVGLISCTPQETYVTPTDVFIQQIWDLPSENIESALAAMEVAHPDFDNLPLTQQNVLATEALADSIANSQQLAPRSYTLPGSNSKLNKAELVLCASDIWRCGMTKVYADSSLKIAGYYGDTVNGKGDAFRHAHWCLQMRTWLGQNWAIRFATAHENGGTNIDNKMDMFNNAVGWNTFVWAWENLEKKISTLLADGKLRYIKNGMLVPSNQ
jgi:hypothetical protein